MEYFYGKNRQIHAHKTSSELINGRAAQGVIAKVLGYIAYFYNEYESPKEIYEKM